MVGTKQFLNPMLDASFDLVAKKVMHCVFHYISAFLVFSSVVLLVAGSGLSVLTIDVTPIIWFIIAHYIVFAFTQIIITLTSGIENGIIKLFQWMFFISIAVFAWLGIPA